MKRYKVLLSCLIVAVLVLSLIRVVVSNTISTGGVALGKMEEEISYYKTQNLMYKEKIYTLSSLNNVSSKASKLGFIDKKIGFVVGKSPRLASSR